MAKVVITLTDMAGGAVEVKFISDPPIPNTPDAFTPAMSALSVALRAIADASSGMTTPEVVR